MTHSVVAHSVVTHSVVTHSVVTNSVVTHSVVAHSIVAHSIVAHSVVPHSIVTHSVVGHYRVTLNYDHRPLPSVLKLYSSIFGKIHTIQIGGRPPNANLYAPTHLFLLVRPDGAEHNDALLSPLVAIHRLDFDAGGMA